MFRKKPSTAAEWVVHLDAGAHADIAQDDLREWLADPAHREELAHASVIWKLASRLSQSPVANAYMVSAADQRPSFGWASARASMRWSIPFGVAALAAACVAFFIVSSHPSNTLSNNEMAGTRVGEIVTYTLPDKSTVTMGADSSLYVNFMRESREIRLDSGEIYLDVVHDPARPFVVTAGKHDVLVTGTKFDVNYSPREQSVDVAVVEGNIRVGRDAAHGSALSEQVSAGQVVQFPSTGPSIRKKLTPLEASAWRERKLHFDNTHLRDVLLMVNRYAPKPIIVTDRDIGNLTLSGAFEAGQTDVLLFSLRELYGIESEESDERWLLVRQASAEATPRVN